MSTNQLDQNNQITGTHQRIWIKSKTADATVKGPSKKSIITNTTIKISILREPLATDCFKPLLTVMIPI
jgi:hypothetical protein